MAGELERTGLEALMDLSRWRGSAKEYLSDLDKMIAQNKRLDTEVGKQAKSLKSSEGEVKRAAASMKQLASEVEATGRFYASFGRNLQQFGKNLSRYVTLPLLAVGGASAKFAIDFEQKMANIQSIGRQTTAELGKLGDELIAMSTDLNMSSASAVELADTFYFLQGSGFEGADAMKVLRVAAQASQAGITDLQSATDGLVYSLNAYGAGADEARKFSDTLFKTVDLGIIGYDEFANAIGLVTGQAAASGVSFVELNAAIATISRTTKGASRIAREFNTFLTGMTDPTKQLDKLFMETTGHSAAWMLQNEGLEASLRVVADATGGSAEKINQLFGNMRAGRAVTSLLRGDMADFEELLVGIGDASGATAAAAAINIDTTAAAFTNLKNSAIAAGIKLAESYLPTIRAIVEMMVKFTDTVSNLTDSQKTLILAIGGVTAAMGPFLSIFGTGLEMYGNLIIAASKAAGGMRGMIAVWASAGGVVAAILLGILAAERMYSISKKLTEQFYTEQQGIILTAKSYEEYAASVQKASGALPEYQTQLVLSHGHDTKLREGMVMTREEFEKFQTTMRSLGSTTQEFSDSLDEGNLSLKTLKELAHEAKIAIGDMSIESANYANQWRDNKGIIEIPEEIADAWKEASDKIAKIMQELPDILEENEAALNKIVEDYEKERLGLRELGVNKQKKLLGEHQAELVALEAAYNTKRLELIANNDAVGLVALDKAYQKKRNKMNMDYSQDELDLSATNKRKQLELDRAHLEDLIAQRRANQVSLEEQRKKLGLELWQESAAGILKDGVVDKNEQDIIDTLEENFGIQLDNQIKYNLDSLALTKALADGNLTYAAEIAKSWKKLSDEQGGAADTLQTQLDAMPTPEEIMGGFNFEGAFDAIGGAAASASSAVSETDTATASLGKTVKDVATAIDEAIAAFESLAGYETDPRLRTALTNIAADIRDAVTIMVRTWTEREDKVTGEAKHAAKFAARAMTVMQAYQAAAEAFKAAAEYSKVSAKTLGDIADNITTAIRHMAAISDMWKPEEVEAIALFAKQVSVILGPFATMADVAKATVNYSKVSRESINDITTNMSIMLGHFNWLYHNTPEIEQDALVFAQAISTIATAMGSAADGLSKLTDYTKVSSYRMKDFIDDMNKLVELFDVPEIGEDMVAKAQAFADLMEPVTDIVKDGTDALATLSTYSHQAVDGVEDFVDDLEKLAMRMLVRVPWFGENSIAKLKAFADAIKPVSSIVSDGIKGLIGLRDYSSEAIEGAEDFVDDIEELTMRILVRVPWMGQSSIDKLQAFANAIAPASEIVSSGMDALSGLQEISAPTLDDVQSFIDNLVLVLGMLEDQLPPTSQDLIDELQAFANAVGPAADIVGDGVDALVTLGEDYITKPSEEAIQIFIDGLKEVLRIISENLPTIEDDLTTELTAFADAIGPVGDIIKGGMDALEIPKATVTPAETSVVDFMDALKELVRLIGANLPSISNELIIELTRFSDTVDPAASIIKDGIDALEDIGGYESNTKEIGKKVEMLMADLVKLKDSLKNNLPTISVGLIASITEFKEDIELIAKTMKAAIDLLEQMAGLTDLPSFKKDLEAWSNTIIDTLDTLLSSMEMFLDKHPEITAAEFHNVAKQVTDDLNAALTLLTGHEADAPNAAITTTGFARLAQAINKMSLSAISDLNDMETAIGQIVQAMAAIPRTVIVKFVSNTSSFSLPASLASLMQGEWGEGKESQSDPSTPYQGTIAWYFLEGLVNGVKPSIKNYDTGGIVPGPIGKPQLAMVHGGETIVPPATQTQYNSMTNNNNYNTTFSLDAHYANRQSEASIRDDLALMQLMHQTG